MVFVVLKNILREKLRVFVDRMRICGIHGTRGKKYFERKVESVCR